MAFRRFSSLLLAHALLSFCLLARRELWVFSGDSHIFTPKVVFLSLLTIAFQKKSCLYTHKDKNNHPKVWKRGSEMYSLSQNSSFLFFFSFLSFNPIHPTANGISCCEFLFLPLMVRITDCRHCDLFKREGMSEYSIYQVHWPVYLINAFVF